MSQRNVVSWTAMISAFSKRGQAHEALTLFYEMQQTGVQPNHFTFATVLPACARLESLERGKEIHEHIIRSGFQSDIVVGNSLVDMYAKCRSIENARKVFDKMPERNVVSWNAMIAGYARNAHVCEALKLFRRMPERDVVSWTAMVAGCAQNGHFDEALKLFRQMLQMGGKPNSETCASILPACANLAALWDGKEIHQDIIRSGFQSDVFVGNALVDMYAKCGSIEDARQLFDKMVIRDLISWNAMVAGYAFNGRADDSLKFFQKMPELNVISWTTMIAGYTQNGHFDEAVNLFQQMQLRGLMPDLETFAIVLSACANLAALHKGKKVHENIIKHGCQSDVFVMNALIDMYAKCGSIGDARKVFNKMSIQDTVTWTVIIGGYAMHGYGKEALQLFDQMQLFGPKPDAITFIGVLSACCHVGLVDDGWQYFHCMSRNYCITPEMEHYCCMVDLLGRAGHLDEALDFINKMPFRPGAALWVSLLGACRIHANVDLGEQVAGCLLELDPENAAHYVLLSNIYAAADRWDDVDKVRKMMKDRRVKKCPGYSWVEINHKVYTFLGGGRSHPQMQKIYAKWAKLAGQMKEAGYVPDMKFALHDVEEEQKDYILCHHSEKLAIVFGLINTAPRTPIRIVKNLRVCGDCHSATKFISKIAAREIIVRDANRFHYFKDGSCSCRDYW